MKFIPYSLTTPSEIDSNLDNLAAKISQLSCNFFV